MLGLGVALEVVRAQGHLEAVQAGDAIGLVLGDLEVHLVGRYRGDVGGI